jgi:hypothetical protein
MMLDAERDGMHASATRRRREGAIMFKPSLLASLIIGLAAIPVAAQQPTQEQRDAIRAACRSDFIANCSSVQPGGRDAFECLLRNDAKLSASCKAAVGAVAASQTPQAPQAPKPSPAAPSAEPAPVAASPGNQPGAGRGAQAEQIKAVRKACTLDDIAAHCSWISPGSPEILLCLQANAADLSPACQTAVAGLPPPSELKASETPAAPPAPAAPAPKKPPAPTRAAAPPSPVPAVAPAVAAKPTAQQTSAIRAACRSDFMSHCTGVTPGGAEALQCLQRNASELSAACRSAVAAIGGGAPAAAGAAATTAAPAVTPLTLPPFMLPRRRLLLLAICENDAKSICAGSQPGGGRVLDCLAANASSLSPNCYAALARAAHE